MSKPEQSEELALHDLFTREIRPIRNWHELLERWQAAVTLEEMLGLLHVGFQVSLRGDSWWRKPEYDRVDRLIFYFTIADGWDDNYRLKTTEDGEKTYEVGQDRHGNVQSKTPSELRQQLARKAFDMLCLNFFQVDLLDENREFKYVWEGEITSERLFPIIQNFFRAEEGRFNDRIGIRNFSHREKMSHNEQQADDFLLKLSKFIWGWREREVYALSDRKAELEKQIKETRIRIDTSKAWMIEVLSALGKLSLLRERILELDKICLAKIKQIALRNEFSEYKHPVMKSRKVATIDEACYLGSVAAWFLNEYELKKVEHERLSKIIEAERAIQEAQRNIKKLFTPNK